MLPVLFVRDFSFVEKVRGLKEIVFKYFGLVINKKFPPG